METPPYLLPFVAPTPETARERHGSVDLYLPASGEPRPAILFVHGGPVPADRTPTPRDWPVFVGYGSTAAARGFVGATVDHGLRRLDDFRDASRDIRNAVELLRADPRIDRDRIVLWFFSGGAPLSGEWMREAPPWLRGIAATYPMIDLPVQVDGVDRPVDAVTAGGTTPILVTRVGLERVLTAGDVVLDLPAAVERFLAAAGDRVTVIDVPHGRHGFDHLDDTDESRAAIAAAFDHVSRWLQHGSAERF